MADDKKTNDNKTNDNKKRDTLKMPGAATAKAGVDGLPSDAELDALQSIIDNEKEAVAHRDNNAEDADETPDAQRRVEELELELANLKDQALRAMAEADNVKKRAAREVAAAKTYGIERFAIDVLSISDNLSRALQTLDGKAQAEMGENAKTLIAGIELTEKELMAILARHGITAVPGQGSKFDPNVHQAVAEFASDEDKGNVAQVMQTGFKLGERTLRAAMVAVSTGKA